MKKNNFLIIIIGGLVVLGLLFAMELYNPAPDPPVDTDTGSRPEMPAEIAGNQTAVDVFNEIDKLWNAPRNPGGYGSINADIDSKFRNELLNEKETKSLKNALDISYIHTLITATNNFFRASSCPGSSAFNPVFGDIRRYRGGNLASDVGSIYTAGNDYYKLEGKEQEIAEYTSGNIASETDIDQFVVELNGLRNQPYLTESRWVKEKIDAAISSLKGHYTRSQIQLLDPSVKNYVFKQKYAEATTADYIQKLNAFGTHRHVDLNQATPFIQGNLDVLKQQKEMDVRYNPYMMTKQSQTCDEIFGKFEYYRDACAAARASSPPSPPTIGN